MPTALRTRTFARKTTPATQRGTRPVGVNAGARPHGDSDPRARPHMAAPTSRSTAASRLRASVACGRTDTLPQPHGVGMLATLAVGEELDTLVMKRALSPAEERRL